MLHLIQDISDSFFEFLTQDPVRPNIPVTARIGEHRSVFVKPNDIAGEPKAITCVSYQLQVPESEDTLFGEVESPEVAIFYTIWSYAPGAGRELIFEACDWIRENMPEIKRFVTLSPTTEMARKFHIKNGATVFRINENTVNYEYMNL
jgi:hypothetical protein